MGFFWFGVRKCLSVTAIDVMGIYFCRGVGLLVNCGKDWQVIRVKFVDCIRI